MIPCRGHNISRSNVIILKMRFVRILRSYIIFILLKAHSRVRKQRLSTVRTVMVGLRITGTEGINVLSAGPLSLVHVSWV